MEANIQPDRRQPDIGAGRRCKRFRPGFTRFIYEGIAVVVETIADRRQVELLIDCLVGVVDGERDFVRSEPERIAAGIADGQTVDSEFSRDAKIRDQQQSLQARYRRISFGARISDRDQRIRRIAQLQTHV